MLNPLSLLRYLVFVVFVVSNAITASAAAWNLSIVEGIAGDVASTGISIFLIVLGALGLIVIFTVIFFDLWEKDIFISRIWFELSWVVLFFMMELGGAAAITAQNNGQVCNSPSLVSLCASIVVLQGFTWICAILLFGYFILIFILTVLKYKDDSAIWCWTVRKLIWQHTHKTVIPPSLPPLPSFRTYEPGIVAPRPRRITTVPDPDLSYRSGLGFDYQIEHFQPPALGVNGLGLSTDPSRPLSPLLFTSSTLPTPLSPTRNLPQKPLPAAFAPFYPSYVQAAINPEFSTEHSSTSQVRNLTGASSYSPPPLGDWPRRDATSLPVRGRRRQNPPAPYSFTMPTAAQQRRDQPQQPRPRPSGPRRRSTSGDIMPLPFRP